MKKWDYRVLELAFDPADHEEDLGPMGEQGWELVAVVALPGGPVAYLRRDAEARKEAWASR